MTNQKPIFHKFATPELDENRILKNITFHPPEDFNFAYDVVDILAKENPDKLAMLWLSNEKEEKRFTFADMAKYSDKTANFFASQGIKKGDKVLLVLKRHYEFWYCLLALHKIGAVAVPATHLLTQGDFEFRFKAGDVSAIVCTADGTVSDEAEKATKNVPNVKTKIIVNVPRLRHSGIGPAWTDILYGRGIEGFGIFEVPAFHFAELPHDGVIDEEFHRTDLRSDDIRLYGNRCDDGRISIRDAYCGRGGMRDRHLGFAVYPAQYLSDKSGQVHRAQGMLGNQAGQFILKQLKR